MRVLLALALGACGSSSTPAGDPILSGSVTGSYDGHPFTATYGFATVYKNVPLIGFADAAVHCGSEAMPNPPTGSGVIASPDVIAVGSYTTASVEIYRNVGGFNAVESNGDLEITAVDAMTVAGSISYTYTDSTDGKMYSASGTFEVTHCP